MINRSAVEAHTAGAEPRTMSPVGLDHERGRRAEDRQFAAMQGVFAATGGVLTGDQLVGRLRRRASQPISVLARWIVARDVVSLSWRGQLLIPLFQFDVTTMRLLDQMRPILGELVDMFDDSETAQWFTTPNRWTGGVAPAERIRHDGLAVLEAARADRFLLRG